MKITVLGYWGAYPEKGEATAGYLLETDRHKILIDCGSGVLSQLFYYTSVEELDAVFLSHYHSDHMVDIGCLQYASRVATVFNKRTKPLPIYGHTHSEKFNTLTYKNKDVIYTVGREIEDKKKLTFNDIKVSFTKTIHPEYNLALRFEYEGKSLVYTGDTEYNESLIYFADTCDLLICETSLYADESGIVAGHMTSFEAGKIASKANARKLLLTHFPHKGNIEQLKEEASQKFNGIIELARCGKVVEV